MSSTQPSQGRPGNGLSIFASWAAWFRAVSFVLICLGAFYVVFNTSGPEPVSMDRPPDGTTIAFGESGRLINYTVHPRDYQDSGIEVKKGDRIVIDAVGSINIGLCHLIKVSELYDGKWDELQERKEEMTAYYPWCGPQGIDVERVDNSAIKQNLSQWSRDNLDRTAQSGQLLAIIAPADSIAIEGAPQQTVYPTIPLGRSSNFTAERSGRLYFVVNDSWSSDRLQTRLWWLDNVGFFNLVIRIES